MIKIIHYMSYKSDEWAQSHESKSPLLFKNLFILKCYVLKNLFCINDRQTEIKFNAFFALNVM